MTARPEKLDHVALWVSGRESIAGRLAEVGLREIERTDTFTLLGGDARRGKLTLFDADGPREAGALVRIGIGLPSGSGDDLDAGEGLVLRLVPGDAIDLDHIALQVRDPAASARRWLDFGFRPAGRRADGVERVQLGGAFLELLPGRDRRVEQPLLNHIGALVDSAAEQRELAEANGVDVLKVVDAPNTLAVFVRGPDDVVLEYIEHKPSFSLT